MAEAVILKKILEELMENAKQIRQEELEQFADTEGFYTRGDYIPA